MKKKTGLPRISKRMFPQVENLIQCLCANYQDGNCLLLDDGYEPCPCPQLLTQSLICRYFRTAVLPADRELHAKITKNIGGWKRCTRCQKLFEPKSNRAICCERCAGNVRREKICLRVRRFRDPVSRSPPEQKE